MRILFVTPYVPSKFRIRPYAFIRELAQRGHEITLVCLVQPRKEAHFLQDVTPYCHRVYPIFLNRFELYLQLLRSLPSKVPLSVAYCRSEQFEQMLAYLLGQYDYDAVHTEFMRAAPYTVHLDGMPKVYDAVDSLTLAYQRSLVAKNIPLGRRAMALVEWMKLRTYETSVLPYYDHLLVSSPVDQKMLESANLKRAVNARGEQQRQQKRQVTVIPNGVDLGYFHKHEGPRDENSILFLGKMNYYVNVASVLWFFKNVLPKIRRKRPNTRFIVAGRDPSGEILSLVADPMVEVTGSVDDVRPYLERATVSISPMISGSGIQNKILEYMAVGTPCVTTSLAYQALNAEPGKDILVSDSAEGFADNVLAVLDDPALQQTLSDNGRLYVEKYHVWEKIGENLNKVYENLALAETPWASTAPMD